MNASSPISKLGIIAGSGDLPERLAKACEAQGIEIFIAAIEGQAPPGITEGRHHIWESIGGAGRIIKTLKNHDVKDLVLIGGIRRPSFSELKPDLKTAEFFARIGFRALGDNDLLSLLKEELHRDGFTVHGIQSFAGELLAPIGALGKLKPSKRHQLSIRRGVEASQNLGALDIGQSVVVQQGIIIGVEGIEGTDTLIERCGLLLRKGGDAFLVKTCKPKQDRDLDLPTIGPHTVETCAKAGLSGIVIQAGASLIVDQDKVIELANRHKIFIFGYEL